MKELKIPLKSIRGLTRRGKTVNKGIRICIECGSTLISINLKSISCNECGSVRKFESKLFDCKFNQGDKVRIIDSEENSNLVYKIEKIQKSSEGTIYFVLKTKSSPITLFYHENKDSYLKRVEL